ncbi:ABC transporter substrate-binding protein [Mycoplana sp. BE70]|uniref:ABC transporter substrate-binding protein n=1 Tax=Mycoplana sp. BE70 TaxID=2817775 RepID=UPI00286CF043|nr:ABC transporter substrate-binding protein [Mycoplana sp. BE70]
MNPISRRFFLGVSSAALAATAAGFSPALAAAPAGEAPMLKALVDAGKLPPLAERLPENPMVVTPLTEIGKYGGTWRSAIVGGGSLSMLFRYQAYEPLVRYNPEWSGIVPNVAEAYEANEAGTEFTFTLRKGMKWSDGHPFTTEDVMFWYEDVFMNPDIEVTNQDHLIVGDDKAIFSKIDDQRFKVSFKSPNGLFLLLLAWADSDQTARFPKHYLSQFLPKYNPDADKLAAAQGMSGWVQLFQKKSGAALEDDFFLNSEIPVVHPWKMKVAPGESTENAVAERNPFYFKVDTAGNQLPYLDAINYALVADAQVLLLKALQGDIDMIDQYIGTTTNKSVLYDGQAKGDYNFYTMIPTEPNDMVICLNMTHPDKVKAELYSNKDFRTGLSMAIDRQALIESVFVGIGVPSHAAIRKGDPLYNERLATQFTEFDLAKANEALDKVVPKKDSEGYRLDASGRRVTIVFETDQNRQAIVDMLQLAMPMLKAAGIDGQLRLMDRSLWEVRIRQNMDYDATTNRFGGGGGLAALLDPRYFVPFNDNAFYAPGWQIWYGDKNAANAVEPPQQVQDALKLYDAMKSTVDDAERVELFKQILEIAADQFYSIGIKTPNEGFGIRKNNMRNIPDKILNSFGYPAPAPTNPEQYFKA